jgi:hypothetical protein
VIYPGLADPLTAWERARNETRTAILAAVAAAMEDGKAELAADNARLREQCDKFKWQVRDTCLRAEKAEAELTTLRAHTDELAEALESVISATCAYLPPDGISEQDCINRVLEATDNPTINAALAKHKERAA